MKLKEKILVDFLVNHLNNEKYIAEAVVSDYLSKQEDDFNSIYAAEIAKHIFYAPATNGKAENSILDGERLILEFAEGYSKDAREPQPILHIANVSNTLLCPFCGGELYDSILHNVPTCKDCGAQQSNDC